MNGRAVLRSPKGSDDGVATLWAVGGIAVLFLVATAFLAFGAVVQTRHRATAAADLAALAGAGYAPYGERAACAKADWVATGMRVRMTRCLLVKWDVLVEVTTALPDDMAKFGAVTAHARAGPVDRSVDTAVTSDDAAVSDPHGAVDGDR